MYNIGLIGKFISKSQMPNLILQLGKEFDIPIKYKLFDLRHKENINLKEFIFDLKKNFKGISVTYPFKEEILNVVQNTGNEVQLTKAANTLLFQNEIIAKNTDYLGFLKSYNFHFNLDPKKILVIGGGGIGRAVCFALGKLNVQKIYLIERDKEKSDKLLHQLREQNINCVSLKACAT